MDAWINHDTGLLRRIVVKDARAEYRFEMQPKVLDQIPGGMGVETAGRQLVARMQDLQIGVGDVARTSPSRHLTAAP